MANIDVERIATYALTREKREKTIASRWDLSRGKLLKGSTFQVLTDFIHNNVALILNLEETPPCKGSESRPALYFEPSPLRSRRGAYVVGFRERGESLATLEHLREAGEVEFFDLSQRMANWFKQELFWPKTYLFITQISISSAGFSEILIGILATNLAYGELAEHEERVVDQIKQGVISKKIRKGIIYPCIRRKNGKIITERKCKVYEQRTVPAHYWYEFLELQAPYYWQELAEKTLHQLERTGRLVSLQKLVRTLRRREPSATTLAKMRIMLDEITVRAPLSEVGNKKLYLAKSREGYAALIKSSQISALLGRTPVQENRLPLTDLAALVRVLTEVKRDRAKRS